MMMKMNTRDLIVSRLNSIADEFAAEIEALRAEVERLKSMTAVTMGVGSGDGNLFVHGDYDSIKAAQAIVLERDALRAEVEQLAASEKTCRRIANEKTLEAMTLREKLAALKAENGRLREALKDADNELDWIDEEMDTCDHSVGVCTCDYWNMRRKMKAALEQEDTQ